MFIHIVTLSYSLYQEQYMIIYTIYINSILPGYTYLFTIDLI